jgi:hypothetical protein
MSRLSVSAYIEFHQHTSRTFDPYMPIVIIGALAGGVALAVRYGVHSIPGQLAAAGAVGYALVIIIGVPTCVRMNKQIADWSIQNPPREWAQTRALASVSRYSNFILRSRAGHLSSCRDVKYRSSITGSKKVLNGTGQLLTGPQAFELGSRLYLTLNRYQKKPRLSTWCRPNRSRVKLSE